MAKFSLGGKIKSKNNLNMLINNKLTIKIKETTVNKCNYKYMFCIINIYIYIYIYNQFIVTNNKKKRAM